MINIKLENELDAKTGINKELLSNICSNIFKDSNHDNGNITIIISNDKYLGELKKKYFNKNEFTDVITFNLEENNEPIEGEIYISLDRVKENAKKFKQNIEIELNRVIIHGCLHLVGYNDQTSIEKQKMTQLEYHYLNYINQ